MTTPEFETFEDFKRRNFVEFKREFPSKCFSCGKVAVVSKKIEYDACIKHDGQLHDFIVEDFEIFECEDCHEQMFGGAADHQLTTGLRSHLLKCTGSCHKQAN